MDALPPFSHIYYERRARDLPLARMVRNRYRHLPHTEIADYAEIFNRKRQHFQIQKRSQALILAVAQKTFLYRGAERIRSFGDAHIYYTDQVRNCVYNCSYCFLQGMHRSAHCVLFVNEQDYHNAVVQRLRRESPLNLSISYLSDLLAVECVVPLCRNWIELARRHPALHIEIRTKGNNTHALRNIDPTDNVRLVWSLTPRGYAQRYEHGTASLPNRLMAARQAIEMGWKVSLCFDPIIFGDGWLTEYRHLLQQTFGRLPADEVESVSYGTFRMHSDYFKRMLNQQAENDMLLLDYDHTKNLTAHKSETQRQIRRAFEHEIGNYYPLERVFFVHG